MKKIDFLKDYANKTNSWEKRTVLTALVSCLTSDETAQLLDPLLLNDPILVCIKGIAYNFTRAGFRRVLNIIKHLGIILSKIDISFRRAREMHLIRKILDYKTCIRIKMFFYERILEISFRILFHKLLI